jgi:peptidyl-tRNA hydrolase, PTH2 family
MDLAVAMERGGAYRLTTRMATVFMPQHPATIKKITHVGTPTNDRFAPMFAVVLAAKSVVSAVSVSPELELPLTDRPAGSGARSPIASDPVECSLFQHRPNESNEAIRTVNQLMAIAGKLFGMTEHEVGEPYRGTETGNETQAALGPGDVKQVIVIRRDLHMRRGKEIAQGSHASSAWISFAVADALRNGETTFDLSTISEAAKVWLTSSFRKVTLQVQTEEEIVALHDQAVAAGLESQLITDSGKTEFGGNPTITALAIGPNRASDIDIITGHLGIY